MYRKFFSIALGVLFLAGSAQAFVGWAQDFDISARNVVKWGGGVGSAKGANLVTYAEKQQFKNGCFGVLALQKTRGTVTQVATISGEVGPSTIRQNAKAVGTQYIPVGSKAAFGNRAWQNLGVNLRTIAIKPYGVGTVEGKQSFIGGQMQAMTTPHGCFVQSQYVNATQSASITTTTDIDPTVKSTINIKMNQNPGMMK